jgi:membrane protease YdiL (CAAX protease family)
MGVIINELISAILQIIAFSVIPFIFFLFRKDKSVSFLQYIGLYKASPRSIGYAIVASLLFLAPGLGMIFADESMRHLVVTPPSVTGKIRLIDSKEVAVALILIVALIKTSFSEEIFFRGFIARRLINVWGFVMGNIVQSLIFGIVHLLLFWQLMNPSIFAVLFIFTFSTLAGWVIGVIKEKYARGSIVPGWVAHALGNTLSYTIIVFIIP